MVRAVQSRSWSKSALTVMCSRLRPALQGGVVSVQHQLTEQWQHLPEAAGKLLGCAEMGTACASAVLLTERGHGSCSLTQSAICVRAWLSTELFVCYTTHLAALPS